MSVAQKSSALDISRRRLIAAMALVVAAGSAVLTDLTAGPAAAAAKLSQSAAGYKDKPMGKAQCDNCAVWQGSASCKLVDGPISASGWCNLYSAKS